MCLRKMLVVMISILGIITSAFAKSNLSDNALCEAATVILD